MPKTIKIVHTADVHLDGAFTEARLGSDQGDSLRQATREAFTRVIDLVKSEDAAALLIAGDLYDHEYERPETGAFLVETLASLGDVPVIIAPGNCDPWVPGSLYARLNWPANVHIFRTETPAAFTFADRGLAVHGVAHRRADCRDRLLARLKASDSSDGLVHVGLAHASDLSRAPEGKATCAPFEPADLAAAPSIRCWALGHYHTHGPVKTGNGPAAHYSGCIQGRHFGETGPRHALVVSVTAKRTRVKAVPVHALTFEASEIDVTEIATGEALMAHIRGLCDAPAWANALVRFRLVGEAAPTLEIDPARLCDEVADVFHHVTFEDRTEPVLDTAAAAVERTARGEFIRRMLVALERAEDEAAREHARLALRVGLAAYDGRQTPIE